MSIVAESAAPAPLETLNNAFSSIDSSVQPYNVLTGFNLGNNTVLLSVPMYRFYEISAVANERGLTEQSQSGPITQRKLEPSHAKKLAVYILKGVVGAAVSRLTQAEKAVPDALKTIQKNLGTQPYLALQPIVANLRSCKPGGVDLPIRPSAPGAVTLLLGDQDVLWVVDGQHRRYALELVFDFLKEIKLQHEYPKRLKLYPIERGHKMSTGELEAWHLVYDVARTACRVMVELHLGLDPFQEQQLFHDLNNLGKKVESSLAFAFDNSNPINIFIKQELVDAHLLHAIVEEKDVKDWHNDPGAITWKDLTAINAILFMNRTNIKGAQPGQTEERAEVAREFWDAVNKIEHFGRPQAKKKTVAAQPVVLKALAKLTFDFAFGRAQDEECLDRLLAGIPSLDFSHENPMWRYYELNEKNRTSLGLDGLSAYLPPDSVSDNPSSGANRNIGRFDPIEQVMRFEAKHNDIFPLIGDMVRWKLGLPPRHRNSTDDVTEE